MVSCSYCWSCGAAVDAAVADATVFAFVAVDAALVTVAADVAVVAAVAAVVDAFDAVADVAADAVEY